MFFQIGQQRFIVKHFFGTIVLQHGFAAGVVYADYLKVITDDFISKSAVTDGFFRGVDGFDGQGEAADCCQNKGKYQ